MLLDEVPDVVLLYEELPDVLPEEVLRTVPVVCRADVPVLREADGAVPLRLEVVTVPVDDELPLETVDVPVGEVLLLRTLLTAVPRDAVPDCAVRETDVLLDDDAEDTVALELCAPLLVTEAVLFPLLTDERELLASPLPVPLEPKCTGVPPCPNAGPPGNGSGCPGP